MTEISKENLDIYRKLKRLPIFWRMSEEGIISLINLMEFYVCSENQPIFNENDTGDALFIILEGKIEIFKNSDSSSGDKFHPLAILGEKMIFGEMTLLAPGKRTAGARAKEQSTLLKLDKTDFKKALDEGKLYAYQLSYNIGCIVCERLRLMDNRLINLMQENEGLKKQNWFSAMV